MLVWLFLIFLQVGAYCVWMVINVVYLVDCLKAQLSMPLAGNEVTTVQNNTAQLLLIFN
jgi:hypothetical protein